MAKPQYYIASKKSDDTHVLTVTDGQSSDTWTLLVDKTAADLVASALNRDLRNKTGTMEHDWHARKA